MKTHTILIIEDNEDINLLTKATLASKGHNVLCAFNGKEGIKLAQNNDVDFIILDVMMPDMDGYEVLSILKGNDNTKKIPVAFFSARTQKEEIEKGLSFGAIKYFRKPFDPIELLSEVDEILSKYN